LKKKNSPQNKQIHLLNWRPNHMGESAIRTSDILMEYYRNGSIYWNIVWLIRKPSMSGFQKASHYCVTHWKPDNVRFPKSHTIFQYVERLLQYSIKKSEIQMPASRVWLDDPTLWFCLICLLWSPDLLTKYLLTLWMWLY